jgi:hypothetical protein
MSDTYVQQVLNKYDVTRGGTFLPELEVVWPIRHALQVQLGNCVAGVELSGSNAKGTAVLGGTDVDAFVSFYPDSGYYLRDIYQDVYDAAQGLGWRPRKQNVSIRVMYNGHSVDLVPGRQHPTSWTGDHWLFRRRANTWQQTNVKTHIETVRAAMCTPEIRAVKIWRNLHGLDFPSFYLELLVIDGLRATFIFGGIADRVAAALRYVAGNIERARVIDPANCNNVVSDDLTAAEKATVAAAAERALRRNWTEVIW